jgi:hypothetical protein
MLKFSSNFGENLLLFPLIFSFYFFNDSSANRNKLARNICSAAHCYFICLSGLCYLLNFYSLNHIITISTLYFVYDTLWILYNNPWQNRYFIIHHGISLYLLREIVLTQSKFLVFLLWISEISNVVNYPIYHLIQLNLLNQVKTLKKIQIYLNASIRIFGYGLIGLLYRDLVENWVLRVGLYGIQLMSFIWFIGQYRGYLQEFNKSVMD